MHDFSGGGPPTKKPKLDPVTEVIAGILGVNNDNIGGISGIGHNDLTHYHTTQTDERYFYFVLLCPPHTSLHNSNDSFQVFKLTCRTNVFHPLISSQLPSDFSTFKPHVFTFNLHSNRLSATPVNQSWLSSLKQCIHQVLSSNYRLNRWTIL